MQRAEERTKRGDTIIKNFAFPAFLPFNSRRVPKYFNTSFLTSKVSKNSYFDGSISLFKNRNFFMLSHQQGRASMIKTSHTIKAKINTVYVQPTTPKISIAQVLKQRPVNMQKRFLMFILSPGATFLKHINGTRAKIISSHAKVIVYFGQPKAGAYHKAG